jgi:hypothetical protein
LWLDSAGVPQGRRRMHLPPLAVALLLAAIGSGILAGAEPTLRTKSHWLFQRPGRAAVTVVLDQGMCFAADGPRPYAVVAARLMDLLRPWPGMAIELWQIGGSSQRIDLDQLERQINSLRPTVRDSDEALNMAVNLAADGSGVLALIVLSDRQVSRPTALRTSVPFCQLPISHVQNKAWIIAAGARNEPKAQVMVRLGWVGNPWYATVRITSSGKRTVKNVLLHRGGGVSEESFFIDVPKLGETAECEIDGGGPLESYYLARGNGWPRVELATGELPQSVERIIDIYRQDRPAWPGAPLVTVGTQLINLGNGPGVVCATVAEHEKTAGGGVTILDHPITHGLDFSELGPAGGGGQMPADYSAVVSMGGVPVIALAENPKRIWIGLTASQWQAWGRSTDFVHFWARAIGWCGGGGGSGDVYRGQELPPLGGERSPVDKSVQVNMRAGADLGEQVGKYVEAGIPVAWNVNRPPMPSQGQIAPLSLPIWVVGTDMQPILAAAAALLASLGILIGTMPLRRRVW